MGGMPFMGWQFVEDDDDEDQDAGQAGKPADLPAPARKHLKKVETELAAAKKALEDLQKEKRTATVQDTVKAKGYDPKVAGFIPVTADSPEAVEKWLEDNGSMFTKTVTESVSESTTAGPDALSPELMAELAKLTAVTAEGMSPTKMQSMRALIEGTNSKEELDKLLAMASKARL